MDISEFSGEWWDLIHDLIRGAPLDKERLIALIMSEKPIPKIARPLIASLVEQYPKKFRLTGIEHRSIENFKLISRLKATANLISLLVETGEYENSEYNEVLQSHIKTTRNGKGLTPREAALQWTAEKCHCDVRTVEQAYNRVSGHFQSSTYHKIVNDDLE